MAVSDSPSIEIEVQIPSHLTYDDMKPLLDPLEENSSEKLKVWRSSHEQAAAGIDVAIIVEIGPATVTAVSAAGFLGWAIKRSMGAFLDHLGQASGENVVAMLKKARWSNSSRKNIPMSINAGAVRFNFAEDEITLEDLKKRLDKARELVSELPENAFSSRSFPPECGLYWDEDTDSWQVPEDVPNPQNL